ncbi:uncharacterized protein JCM10292_004600 [Rhodotorula paludigena]|uniref:uncharacterized protein n=1 Tax=Rhodotorula paludigena TaxID=86838 RepID=UPI003176D471
MPYVDSHGRVHASPPLLQRLLLALRSLYLAVALFLSTLFSPNSTRRLPPSSSLRDADRRRRDQRGPGSGGRGSRIGGTSSGPSVVFNPRGGGCGPCGGVQM